MNIQISEPRKASTAKKLNDFSKSAELSTSS